MISYYATEADAISGTNSLGTSSTYDISEVNGCTHWRIASNSTGSSSQSTVFTIGITLATDGIYHVYSIIPISYYPTAITAFTPSYLPGLQLWLDAKDPLNTGTVPSINATVSQWFDKSGNGRNSTSSIGTPTYTTAGLAFDGNSSFIFPAGSFPYGSTPYSIYMILNFTGQSPHGVLSTAYTSSPGAGFAIYNQYPSYMNTDWLGNNINTPSNSLTPGQDFLYESFLNVGVARYVYQDASLIITDTGSNTRVTTQDNVKIGNGPTGNMLGTISEILIYNTHHTTTQRQNIEGYLALKWNIQSKLPVSHPYYVAPGSNMITVIDSYTINNVNGFTKWFIAPNSTGSSSKLTLYNIGDNLNEDGSYFIYPNSSISYYPTEADALTGTNFITSNSESYTVYVVNGFTYWRIASNSTGSSSQATIYSTGDELINNGLYYMYLIIPISYYATEADVVTGTNLLSTSNIYTISEVNGSTNWRIAPNSTGSSLQSTVFTVGNTLIGDGVYYVYPVASISYYLTEADAISYTVLLSTSNTYTISEVNGSTYWRIASNSTGSSLQSPTYYLGDLLSNDGVYNLYPVFPISYYPTEADVTLAINLITTGTYDITNPNGFTYWRIATNSTGSSSQSTIYTVGDILTNDGIYNLYRIIPVSYYASEADAIAGTNSIGTNDSYTVFNTNSLSQWRIASSSTGSSSQANVYNDGDVLTSDGLYYMYPDYIPMSYYPSEADALSGTNLVSIDGNYIIVNINGSTHYRIASNSTGSSALSSVFTVGDTLVGDGVYKLYPVVPVSYYPSEADAATGINLITTGSYTITNQNGSTYWRIAANSTGSSSQSTTYAVGDTLNNDGVYYIYPVVPVSYYPWEADAATGINLITTGSYTISEVNGSTYWRIAANSTGSSSQSTTYAVGDTLNNDGVYYIYPFVPVFYYPSEADALSGTNLITTGLYIITNQNGSSYWRIANTTGSSSQSTTYAVGDTLNNDGVYYIYPVVPVSYYPSEADATSGTNLITTGSYTITNQNGSSYWRIASNSTGSSSQSTVCAVGDTLTNDGVYYIYLIIPVSYYASEADAIAGTNYISTSDSYTVVNTNSISQWRIASTSTGSSSQSNLYYTSDPLAADGLYYMYPNFIPMSYYPSEADALAGTNLVSINGSYTIINASGPTYYRIASNSTGSSSQTISYNVGETLFENGIYYLYPIIPISYYDTEANALSGGISLKVGDSYTLVQVTEIEYWRIASNSTGSSSQSPIYTVGNTLANDGIYYVYPNISISYYPTQSDAIAGTNLIIIGPYTIINANGFDYWRIASNSTGSSSQISSYNVNDSLNADGNYFLYPIVPISYYPTQSDATSGTNLIAPGSYTITNPNGFTNWRIASNSTGSSLKSTVYSVGDTLVNDGIYYLYPNIPCFLEGTTILCQINGIERYVPIESIQRGMFVKTSRDGYKMVQIIGKSKLKNPGNSERIKDRLYKCSTTRYPSLTSDLYITGCHSILEFPITEKQKEDSIKELGRLFVTDKKYRIMAFIDERTEPWNSEGVYNIYHFALENDDDGMNYGVYANGGLLVESCALRTLQKRSNMTLI